jgi:aspartate carbamoyltransferase catalytic subunit
LGFEGRDILSVLDFSRQDIETVFEASDKLEHIVKERTRVDILRDKIMASLFFEPSTRTRLSFESAMLRLGGGVTGFADAKVSRAGDRYQETLADTARVIENYADVVVMRHYENGAAAEFARHADVPVINAGDGTNEHPTQALLDLYTIRKEVGRIDNIQVAIISDMKNERVIPSLLYGLAKFDDVGVYLLAPENLRLNEEVFQNIRKLGLQHREIADLMEVVSKVDVIYSNVIRERRADSDVTPAAYVVTAKKLREMKRNAIIMHPLPRLDELSEDVDTLPHARYFQETKYGVITRMALLSLIFGKTSAVTTE